MSEPAITFGTLRLARATPDDVDAVTSIYRACTTAMLARGIRQWDEHYPDRATAAGAARRGDLFLLTGADDDVAVGTVVLNARMADEYAAITWQLPEPALVIHALAIDPRRHGAGLGRAAMACCEAFARRDGYASIRLDAYPGNPAAIALYERLGYVPRGHVTFGEKPPGHQRYAVYEKAISPITDA